MEIIVLVGIPGSGKSTFVQKFFPNYRRINLDTLHSRKREDEEIAKSLIDGQGIIIDNTNSTKKSRAKYINAAKASGIPIRAIYLKCPVDVALKRNASREGRGKVPVSALRFYNKLLQPPSVEEGFDRVEEIDASI